MREPSIGSSNMTSRGFLSSFQCSILRYVQTERTQQAVSVLPSTGSSSTTPKISLLIFSDHEFYMQLLLDMDIKSGSKESADAVFFAPLFFSPALGLPAAPLPYPLSDTSGFRQSPFLSHLLFLVSFRLCRTPGRLLLLSSSHVGPVRTGPVSAQPVRMPTSPPARPSGPAAKLLRTLCVQVW